VFFDLGTGSVPQNTVIGDVNIRYNDHASVRSLRFGKHSMDKLTSRSGSEGPESYRNATLLFTREGHNTFRMSIARLARLRVEKTITKERHPFFLSGGGPFGLFYRLHVDERRSLFTRDADAIILE